MQMVKWFLEQGLAAERTRPADTNGVEVTCCGRNSELGEFLSWVLSLQGEHTRAPWHPVFFPYVPLIFSPLPLSTVTYFWFTGRHPHCPQTRGWTLDRSQARGESWSLPSAVYRGEFFSVLSFSLPFLHFFFFFLNVGRGLFQRDQGWHLPFGTLVWWSSSCNELNHRCRRWVSLIPGRCPGATLIFIQIFDSSVNVTPALQCAEAEG